jgi:D-sedoheptulose 7-phosphate isomerase
VSAPILAILRAHAQTVRRLEPLAADIQAIAEHLQACLAGGGKVVWMGNGGSAADCQHLASELVGRFRRERRGLASLALTTDTSLLTSVANDYGFEQVFARQVRALCGPPDVLVAISTSGTSPNILAALEAAGALGIHRVGLTGRAGGRLPALTEQCLRVDSDHTPRIQEAHILIGHILCELLDAAAEAHPG